MRTLIVGGDAAGMTAASHLRRARPDDEVVVVERGPHTSYSMCGIPFYVGGEVEEADDLVVLPPEKVRERGIDLRLHWEAAAVDADRRRVVLRSPDGQETSEGYDALLLATGAHPVTPPVEGLVEHAHVLRTLEEGQALRAHLDAGGAQRVCVIGAGYIGLELAEALVNRGIDAVLVDVADQPMTTLEPEMGAHVAAALERYGVELRLGETVERVEGDGTTPHRVVTDAGEVLADTVVVATGSRPNRSLASSAGCGIGDSGGVAVDERMRTSVDGVWAAGDVVESVDLVGGLRRNVQLGTHANKQGRIAAIDIAARLGGRPAGEATFPGLVTTAVTKVCDWEIARTGLTAAECAEAGLDTEGVSFTGTATAGYLPDAGTVHVTMRAERGSGRIVGGQLVGTGCSGAVAKRIDVLATWCQLGVTVDQAQLLDLSYAPPFGGVWDLLQVGARKLARALDRPVQL